MNESTKLLELTKGTNTPILGYPAKSAYSSCAGTTTRIRNIFTISHILESLPPKQINVVAFQFHWKASLNRYDTWYSSYLKAVCWIAITEGLGQISAAVSTLHMLPDLSLTLYKFLHTDTYNNRYSILFW